MEESTNLLLKKPLYPLKKASELSGYSVWHLRNGCKNGTIPHTKVGNRYFVNVPKLLALIDSQTTGS